MEQEMMRPFGAVLIIKLAENVRKFVKDVVFFFFCNNALKCHKMKKKMSELFILLFDLFGGMNYSNLGRKTAIFLHMWHNFNGK